MGTKAPNGDGVMGYHVHFGGGAIGLACVYPALKEGSRHVVIVNRVGRRFDRRRKEFADWRSYRKALGGRMGTLAIDIEEVGPPGGREQDKMDPPTLHLVMPSMRKRVLSTAQLRELKETIAEEDAYVMTSDLTQLADLFEGAESFSCALRKGQKHVAGVLVQCRIKPCPVYVFENNDEFTPALGKTWKGVATRVIVDRICIQHPAEYSRGRNRLVEHVSCERDVELQSIRVIGSPPSYWKPVAAEHFGFFEKKKRYMVNCVHTALAILGYSHLCKKHIPADHQSRQVLSIVVDGLLIDPENRRIIDVFLSGKAIQLLVEESDGLRPSEFADDEDAFTKLVSGGRRVLERMSAFPDEIGRVLQKEDTDDEKAHPKMLDRVTRYVKDLKQSIAAEGPDSRRDAYRSFAARNRPHVREIECAIESILDAWKSLMS